MPNEKEKPLSHQFEEFFNSFHQWCNKSDERMMCPICGRASVILARMVKAESPPKFNPRLNDYLNWKTFEKHSDLILSYVKYHGSRLFADRDIWNAFITLVKSNTYVGSDGKLSTAIVYSEFVPIGLSAQICTHECGMSLDLDRKIAICGMCKSTLPIKEEDVEKIRKHPALAIRFYHNANNKSGAICVDDGPDERDDMGAVMPEAIKRVAQFKVSARELLSSEPIPPVSDLPDKVDLRDKMPPVQDQGEIGCSSAMAATTAMKFAMMNPISTEVLRDEAGVVSKEVCEHEMTLNGLPCCIKCGQKLY